MKKTLLLLTLFLGVLVAFPLTGNAFPKSDQDCTACHTLSVDEATKTLEELIPGIKVIDVNQGPIKGLWEVGVSSRGQKGVVYLDYSKKRIISGNILDIATKTNYTQESFSRINKVDVSRIPLENAVVMGDKSAPNRIIVFDDPE